jgi:hypothetical protein
MAKRLTREQKGEQALIDINNQPRKNTEQYYNETYEN